MITLALCALMAVLTAWTVHDLQAWAERRCTRMVPDNELTATTRGRL